MTIFYIFDNSYPDSYIDTAKLIPNALYTCDVYYYFWVIVMTSIKPCSHVLFKSPVLSAAPFDVFRWLEESLWWLLWEVGGGGT